MCPLCMTTLALCTTGGASAAGLAALLAKVVRTSDSAQCGSRVRTHEVTEKSCAGWRSSHTC